MSATDHERHHTLASWARLAEWPGAAQHEAIDHALPGYEVLAPQARACAHACAKAQAPTQGSSRWPRPSRRTRECPDQGRPWE